ncbi:MAG: aldo/keto reductase [Anaerovoracaceae bacterium]
MQFRKFKKTGEDVSLMAMGCMRLPLVPGGSFADVDENAATKMIRTAIDKGVNYVDTARMYHDFKGEYFVGKALEDGYREKVFLADKMPVWLVKDEEEQRATFEDQLKQCQTDHFDFYILHNVNKAVWKRAKKLNTLKFMEEMKAAGKIRHIGFSYHDDADFFKEVIDAYPWDFCQIQLNYMDENLQAGLAGLKYAGSKGIPVIIMEPLKGGKLTDILPDSIKDFWNQADVKRSPAEWALRWVADFPEVLTILNGVSNFEQMEENFRVLSESTPNSLTEKEKAIIKEVADEYNKLIKYSCTECKYCMPCPQGINIPMIISFYNDWFLYGKNPKLLDDYPVWNPKGNQASDCTACKECESHCPQSLPISEIMEKAAKIFE